MLEVLEDGQEYCCPYLSWVIKDEVLTDMLNTEQVAGALHERLYKLSCEVIGTPDVC